MNVFGVYRIHKYLIITLATVVELVTEGRPNYFLSLNGGVPEPTVAISTKEEISHALTFSSKGSSDTNIVPIYSTTTSKTC